MKTFVLRCDASGNDKTSFLMPTSGTIVEAQLAIGGSSAGSATATFSGTAPLLTGLEPMLITAVQSEITGVQTSHLTNLQIGVSEGQTLYVHGSAAMDYQVLTLIIRV